MKIDGFTISYSFDTSVYGRKSSNFVSVNFSLPEPVSPDDLDILRLEASKKVTLWAIQDALARGELTQDEAKERLEIIKKNYDGISTALNRKISK